LPRATLKPIVARQKQHPKKNHKNTEVKFFDYIVYFFTIATPLFELPQAYAIYANRSAEDVSLLTWSFFLLDNLVWIIYAMKRRVLPLLITTILYLIIEAVVVVGIILYA
jgi:uncharacterized protein with PQ loop repeat